MPTVHFERPTGSRRGRMPRKAGARILANEEGALMASDPNALRSRRALLTAAAGGAAAVAASAALPLTTLAADGDNLVLGATDNASASETTLTQASDGEVAVRVVNDTQGAAALIGGAGDQTNVAEDTSFTGIYGFTPTSGDANFSSTAMWGDSEDVGVVATGGQAGVIGFGPSGVVGLGDIGGAGVEAWGATPTDVALTVHGKVMFSRSGKSTIGAGKSALKVTLTGVTSSSRIFAVLHSNRAGRYVRAVVPTTGSFTIYLNTTVTSATYIAWFIIN